MAIQITTEPNFFLFDIFFFKFREETKEIQLDPERKESGADEEIPRTAHTAHTGR